MSLAHDDLHSIHHLLISPYQTVQFDQRPVEDDRLLTIWQAAQLLFDRCDDHQITFLAAARHQHDSYHCLKNCLSECSQSAVRDAPLLVLGMARIGGAAHGRAYHDLGIAINSMVLQARSLGIAASLLGDIDRNRARRCFDIPKQYEPLVVLALGYPREGHSLPDGIRRKPLDAFIFAEQWGRPFYGQDKKDVKF